MRTTITIGAQEVTLEANAGTPIRYRNVFGRDLLTLIHEGTKEDGIDLTVASEVAPELAYVMAKTAEKADMSKINKNEWLTWLEQFEPLDLINATEEIFGAYFGDAMTNVEPKKKERKQSAS